MMADEEEAPALITQMGGEGEASVDPVLAIHRAADAGDATALVRALGVMVDAMKPAAGPQRSETFAVDNGIAVWLRHGTITNLARAKTPALRTAAKLDDAAGRRAKVVILARTVVLDAALHGNVSGAAEKVVRAWETASTVYNADTLRRAVLAALSE